MIFKKRGLLFVSLSFVLVILSLSVFVSALDLSVSSEKITDTIINDHNEPAVFDLTISNNDFSNNLEIYTFEKFEIKPSEFNVSVGKTEKIRFEFYPIGSLKDNEGYVKVPYFIRSKGNPSSGTQVGEVVIKLVDFKRVFDVGGENLNPDANSMKVFFYNVEDRSYSGLDVTFSSAFFDDKTESFSLNPYERKEITIPINRDKVKELLAGTYSVRASVNFNDKTEEITGSVKILEKSGLSVNEGSKGFFIKQTFVEKINEGNIPTVAEVTLRKNIISRLLTTFSLEPDRIQRSGFFIDYVWQEELGPNERLNVRATTNWMFPLLLILAILIIAGIINYFVRREIIISKRIVPVRTKKNLFALKVIVKVKARKFVEKSTLYDRLPGITKIHESFAVKPSKLDVERGRIQWDLGKLLPGESREFSYIIYSKMNILGKFELPPATILYEREGKALQVKSNKVFFVNNVIEEVKEEI